MAGRPPTPTKLKILTNQHKKNPKRFKDADKEPQGLTPIGDPPKHFDEVQAAIWLEYVEHCHDGLLCSADRFALERMCYLTDSVRRSEATATDGKALDSLLVQFGMTPSSRARVHISKFQDSHKVNPFFTLGSKSGNHGIE